MNKANMCMIDQRRGKTQRLKQTAGDTHIKTKAPNVVCRFNLTASQQTKSLISSHLSPSEVSGDELKGG